MVLEHTDSLNYNEIMFRLIFARIHISVDNIWKIIFFGVTLLRELEKYGIGFFELNPKSLLQLVNSEVRLCSFHGVVHPFIDFEKEDIVSENLL